MVVTHELDSIFTIGDNSVFLDVEKRTMSALGNPREMRDHPPSDNVYRFLTRSSDFDP